jgi:hypothetical protein
MRLSGSMCFACLKDLDDNLHKLPGVAKSKVDKQPLSYYNANSPDIGTWAQGTIIYDASKLPLDVLTTAIKQSGYHAYRIEDKVFETPLDQVKEDKL